MNVLLTSVGRRSYLVEYFKHAVGPLGKVHAANSTSLNSSFQIADYSVVTPLIYDEKYIPFLLNYCESNNIGILIPLFDVDLPILSEHKHKFSGIGTKVIVSDEHVIQICNDKIETSIFFTTNGINTPKTYNSIDEVQTALTASDIQYPLMIKPRWGMGSISIYQADNDKELRVLYDKAMHEIKDSYLKYESQQNFDKSVIIQEKLKGQEFGLDVINDLEGNYQNTIVKIKHAMRAGETDAAETVDNSLLRSLGQQIAEKLGHIGNLDVDVFMVEGEPYVLEMNARFGGGYPFSHIAGANLPQAIVNWARGELVPKTLLNARIGILAQKEISMTIVDHG